MPKFHEHAKNDLCLRKALYETYRHRCFYCGDLLFPKNMQVDHILATNARPSDDPDFVDYLQELQADGFDLDKPDYIENYAPTCANCNLSKNNRNFTTANLRYFHGKAAEHTEDILQRIEAYRKKKPSDLDDFRPTFATHFLTGPQEAPVMLHREDEMKALLPLLRRDKAHILIHGFGGLGKTTLAQALFHTLAEEYQDAAWIPYSRSLKDSALVSIQPGSLPRQLPPDALWEYLKTLKNDGRRKLIVIDNVDGNPPDPALRHLTGWPDTTVLLTSRMSAVDCYQPVELRYLSEDACVDLFYHNAPERKDDTAVREMVRWANCHTMTVRLLARGAKYEESLSAYAEKVSSLGLRATQHKVRHGDRTDTIAAHMAALFNVQNRSGAERAVLQKLALLPPGAYLREQEAENWFGMEIDVLDRLVEDGWVMLDSGRYSMHPIVQEVIRLEDMPENTAEEFLSCVEDDNYFVDGEVYTEILRKVEIAEAVLKAANREENLQIAHVLHNMGSAYDDLAQYDNALRCYGQAIEIKEKTLGEADTDTATTYNNIGLVYKAMGQLDKALEYYKKALAISEAKLGKEHPDTATTYNNIASVYQDMGQLDKALEYYKKDMAISEAKLGKDHPSTAATYNNIAGVYYAMGQLDKALEYYEKALAIREAKLGKEHPSTATTYNNIAFVYWEQGNLTTAREYLEKALDTFLAKLGREHPYTKGTQNALDDLKKEMQ